jgi:hypothetical protein
VALPLQIPSGWTVQPPAIFEDDDEERTTSIELPFRGPQSASWSVVTTNGGLGDVIPGEDEQSHRLLQHPRFGQILVYSFKEEGTPEVASDWFPEEEDSPSYHAFHGANLSDSDLQAFVDALVLLD